MEPCLIKMYDKKNQTQQEEPLANEEKVLNKELKDNLPKAAFMGSKLHLVQFQGFWCPFSLNLNNILTFQRHFRARDTDIIVASLPKTGTTWLKSLLFAVVNRSNHNAIVSNNIPNPNPNPSPSPSPNPNPNPLLTHHPHELVYRLENGIYGEAFSNLHPQNVEDLPSPRLLHTHLPYSSLPESIRVSGCKILYITRNPLDTFVSQWHFYPNAIKKQMGEDFEPPSLEGYFEDCYEGRVPYGPFFDHVVGYWNESSSRPSKVLFLRYEDLKEDATLHLKKLAKFIGMPFSPREENEGVIKEIIEMCHIKRLRELEINKNGVLNKFFERKTFFRKGEVGDWTNYFSPPMVEKMNKLMEEKLRGTGLSFKLLPDQ